MVKLNGWKETIFSVLILGENFLLIGLSNVKMVFFLSGINLSIFFLLTLQYTELAIHQILFVTGTR